MNQEFNTPILFIIFNRLNTTQKVFEVIREIRPKKLFVAADGYRLGVEGEKDKCDEVKKYVLDNIDWPCEIKTLFREKNLGCGKAVSSAITWFFENVEEGIILEDDCLPNQSFFQFCEELLEKYKDNEEIAAISGNNFNKEKIGEADYYFSKIPHIWGWATWRRTWKKYDVNMSGFPEFKKNREIKKIWSAKNVQNYWLYILNEVYNNKINTWDYQLSFSLFINNSFCICPNVNLVSNIGFGKEFTNTVVADERVSNLRSNEISFPLIHPQEIKYLEKNNDCDNIIALKNYKIKMILKKIGVFDLVKKMYIRLKDK